MNNKSLEIRVVAILSAIASVIFTAIFTPQVTTSLWRTVASTVILWVMIFSLLRLQILMDEHREILDQLKRR